MSFRSCGSGNALPVWIPNCHCEERSDVAISGNNDEIASSKIIVSSRNDEAFLIGITN